MRFFLAAFGVLAGCAPPAGVQLSSSPSPVRDAVAGCWRVESSPGLLGRVLPPTLVRLDTAPSPFGGMRMLRIPRPDPAVPDLDGWGTTPGGDELVLSFSGGYSGVVVRASVHGSELRGRARSWEDVPAWPRRARVRGVRVPCPANAAPG